MPADIRSFFGGKPPVPKQETLPINDKLTGKKRKGNTRKVIEDDSDEDIVVGQKATPKKAASKRAKKDQPEGEETSSASYFASSKPKVPKATPTKTPIAPSAKSTPTRGSTRHKTSTSYAELNDDDAFLDDDKDAGDDIFAAEAKTIGKRKDDDYIEIDSDEEPIKLKNKSTPIRTKPSTTVKAKAEVLDTMDTNSDDAFVVSDANVVKSSKHAISNGSKKRKSPISDDEEDDIVQRPKKAANSAAKKPSAKKARPTKETEPEDAEVQAILDHIPTIRAPTPPPKDPNAAPAKFNFAGGNAGPPPGAGSKEIPIGEENCLAGLKFVFTGLLTSISREDGQELVKRYGGEITGAPSGKTSYVVLGTDAGPSKLRKIQELKIKSIDEDGLFELIKRLPANGGKGGNAIKFAEKKAAEAAKVQKAAEDMELEEQRKLQEAQKKAEKAAAAKGVAPPPVAQVKKGLNTELWTTKYAPTSMQQICGNKGQVAKIQKWLHEWHKNRKRKFQMRGADGTGTERAILIHGPPGIGKTTAAHLAAKLEGFDVIEFNASDTRSKKLVETGLSEVLNNTSVAGFFSTDDHDADITKKRIVLIMDEVDGMSAGDRGGVGAIAKICKTTSIPMILICNDRRLPKMKPFDHVTFDMGFKRPTVQEVRSRVATICAREGLKLPVQVMDALIEGSNKDIRQIINMLSTAKLDQTVMDFDKSKDMSKKWEKHIVLKPWDLCHKLLGGGLFAPSSKATLNDKIELYFNDHEFSYLMVQENYLSTKPLLANDARSEREHRFKALELAEKAAESISDGDLVDRMIHGSQQQWSLMPTHAVFSTVKPASFISGAMTDRTQFTQWLGNNSKSGKLSRYVKEIQSHMRLRTSGDRHEIRQQYLPVLWTQLVNRLQKEGKTCVEEVIELMDTYFLTRDDFDFIMELGLGPQDQQKVNIETQTKASFTRLYNQKSHPMPFMKASNVVAPQKAAKVVPDLEEAMEDDDGEEVVAEEKIEDEDDEKALKTDKYIKQPKKKVSTAPKKKTASKNDKKGGVNGIDLEDESEEDTKPKKAKAKAKAKVKK